MECCMVEEWEKNKPTGDQDVDALLEEVRKTTGQDWQIIMYPIYQRRTWYGRLIAETYFQLTAELDKSGWFNWQVIRCGSGTSLRYATAYLYGLLTGAKTRKKPTND